MSILGLAPPLRSIQSIPRRRTRVAAAPGLEVQPVVTHHGGEEPHPRQTAGEHRPGTDPARANTGQAASARPTRTNLSLDPLLPFDEWKSLGSRVAMYSSASAWWLGDWLVFGEQKYGQRYKEAVSQTGLDYKTLRNYAVVARRFDVSRRRDNVPFQHHAEVCSLPDTEQDHWLDLATRHGWSKSELRRQMRATRPSLPVSSADRAIALRLGATRERLWRDAARRGGQTVDEWMIATLDQAARAAVEAVHYEPPTRDPECDTGEADASR
jgi:hypothetical protein